MAKSGGGGGRSSRITPITNSEGMRLGYSLGGRAFTTKREAQSAARQNTLASASRRIPGSQFMSAAELRAAVSGRGGGGASRARRTRGAAAALTGADRSASNFRRQEQRETFRHRVG